jgi:3-oxoacyl-[acyl-carrier protein] reductase
MFSRALAQELAPRGIRINVLAPGNTATEMNAEVRANSEAMAAFASITPARRVFSPPREMAETILFLLSDKAQAFHGSVLVADEGLSLGV